MEKNFLSTFIFAEINENALSLFIKELINGLKEIFYNLERYIKKIIISPTENIITKNKIKIIDLENNTKKTLFLDLDETLIHKCSNGKYSVIPYCFEFLNEMSKIFEIYIFTASKKDYAEAIVDILDPNCELIDGILSRNCCLETKDGKFCKDLRIVENRNIKDMILVDNLVISFGKTYENGIPILDFYDNENDKQLLFLMDYLKKLSVTDDIREVNKKRFQFKKLLELKWQ